MDTSGNIRPLSEGDPLREGEVEITDTERRLLETVDPSRRRQRLDEVRTRAEMLEREAELDRLAHARVAGDARRDRRHRRALAWPAAHRERQARKDKA